MKLLLLALFIAVGACAPMEPSREPLQVVVNGLADGEPLEVGHIVDLKVKEIVDGQVAAASNPLHPFTAQGLAEIAQAEAIAAAEAEAVVVAPAPVTPELPQVPELPEPVVLPEPALPVVQPEPALPVVQPEPALPVVQPEPALPVVQPEPIVLPEPSPPSSPGLLLPAPVYLPAPEVPEVVPEPIALPEHSVPEVEEPALAEELPAPALQLNGEVYNDGTVSVTVNGPEDPGVYATLQSWVDVLLTYVNSGVQYTQQLI